MYCCVHLQQQYACGTYRKIKIYFPSCYDVTPFPTDENLEYWADDYFILVLA